ncbi:MAG: ABC transporter permease subunit [Sphaerobacter sp.]|nr:ABC transporter permease subunit [Sphaerobacter sp.]
MSVVMLRRAAADLRRTTLWYALGLALYGMLIVLYFPTVRDNGEQLNEYLASFPEALRAAFGIEDITSFAGFLGAEFLNLIWPLIVGTFVVMTGAGLVAQEIERGTVEFWLSVPETRARLLVGKLGAFFSAGAVLVLVTLLTLEIGGAIVGESIAPRALLATGVVLLGYSVAVGGYAALFSALSNDRGRAAGLAAALTLGFYLLWVLSSLSERWDWLRYLTIFTAFDPQGALGSGVVPAGVVSLFAIGIGASIAALVVFQRRDVIR